MSSTVRTSAILHCAAMLSMILSGACSGPEKQEAMEERMKHFPSSYEEARLNFLEASRDAGAVVESYECPQKGPAGEALFTDVSLLGPSDAKAFLLLISGTHGVEGFAGSALQTGLLREGIFERLGDDVAILFVHALNPYGFAHLRRFNEENVDLNRNFGDHAKPYGKNPRYEELRESISPESISFMAEAGAILELIWYRLRHGKDALKEAVTLGQHTDPDGLFYGGDSETWSNRTLRDIAGRYLSGAERVTSVEIHTGLGPFGGAEIILNEAEKSAACRRARAWWGDLAKATGSGESVSGEIRGSVKLALPAMLPDAQVTAVSLEFGTYSAARVFWALRTENWLHHHGGAKHPNARKIKSGLLETFYPAGDEWAAQVWSQGREVIVQALAGLRGDGTPPGKYLPGAEPLYLRGDNRGLLLIHGGGGGSAWDIKEFARAAHRRGYTVWVPSLPGYGTQASDLVGITAEDWLDEAREGVDLLRQNCDTVAVVAHSMGGVIALVVAAEDQRI
jgi:hypothetical protein